MSNVKRKKTNPIIWVAIFVSIALLAVAVSAALTQGFTNANPYGWLDKIQNAEQSVECPIQKNDKLTVVSFDRSVTPDFTKLDWSKAEEGDGMEAIYLVLADVKEDSDSTVDEMPILIAGRMKIADLDEGVVGETDSEYVYMISTFDREMPLYISELILMHFDLEIQGWLSSKLDLTDFAEVKVTEVNEANFLASFVKIDK